MTPPTGTEAASDRDPLTNISPLVADVATTGITLLAAPRAQMHKGLVPSDAHTGSLYQLVRDGHDYDLALDVIPQPKKGLRIDSSNHALDAISRFNFHLYRFNAEKGVENDLKLTGKLLARHHYGDSVHRSGMTAMVHSNFSVTKPVMEAAITRSEEWHFGLTLRWYAPQHNTSDAPLLAKDRLHIGYGGSGADPMSFTRSMAHSHTNLGFFKVFVRTRYVELNIEQPPVLDSPGRDAWQPAVVDNPQVKAVHFGPVSTKDSWNAWIYVLTSKTKDD
ncbi:hypothetical protein DAEQUDRAFT_759458 [Daedalea quercina L-15889]|uniref:Uncharacterized protein n=1 Tax=Daedalea quercina L-15889 TaxID=1314783 RepID=A0A165M4Z1_9APHY|nr:hypothetical protein DAEQUDRAFT_759458 [Daedalea quercina L-15889]